MSSRFEKFRALHAQQELLLLPNAWDARSAVIFEESGFKAIGTSSAAVANSLGYEDGEKMAFKDYLFIIKRIVSSVKIPVTIDLEMGYGENDVAIANNICQLAELGVAGINIEDSFIDRGGRKLKDPHMFANTVNHSKATLQSRNLDLFINVRCDTHILGVNDKQAETIRRLKIYNATAAEGIFVPCITEETDIAEVVANTKLPLNVMALPTLPAFKTLETLGVKRVSMGPFAFQKVYKSVGSVSNEILRAGALSPLFT